MAKTFNTVAGGVAATIALPNIFIMKREKFWNPDTFPIYLSSWMHVENMSESNFSPKSYVAHNLECRIPILEVGK